MLSESVVSILWHVGICQYLPFQQVRMVCRKGITLRRSFVYAECRLNRTRSPTGPGLGSVRTSGSPSGAVGRCLQRQAEVRPRRLSDRKGREVAVHLREGPERQSGKIRVPVSSRSCGPALDPSGTCAAANLSPWSGRSLNDCLEVARPGQGSWQGSAATAVSSSGSETQTLNSLTVNRSQKLAC
jgi:hypothetical protein